MASAVLFTAFLVCAPHVDSQAATRLVGAVTAINGATITVKPDTGDARQIDVPSTASIRRVAPGQKDLSSAETIQFGDLAVGDRVLIRLDPDAPGPNGEALQIVAVKQADVALKQQKDREDWQRNGVGGLVKSVDPADGVITVSSGAGTTAKTIAVHIAKNTMLKRYAPASVSYEAAQPAPIDAIHAGDQLRARGDKNADGTQIDAQEVISGTFRNVSGAIGSIDATNSTFTLKDLATKKPVTVHIMDSAQMRRLPEMVARVLAVRLTGTSQLAGGAMGGGAQPAGAGGTQRGGQWAGGGQGGGDPNQMLNRLPPIKLADLKKGDAVMLVSTDGTTDVTAITLLAGVEPLLEAPAASQNLLNNWSMGSGSGAAEAAAQ
jgi:hypothetical protein